MKKLLDDVRAFHEAGDVPVLDKPQFPADERIELRMDLVEEEFVEFLDACDDRDLVKVSDAIADLIYVLVGAALEFGIPLDKVWDEVQRSNMSKVDPALGKVLRREDGKILKSKNYSPADLRSIIEQALAA